MNNREKDARLHELLYGVKTEMRVCETSPDSIGWHESEHLYDPKWYVEMGLEYESFWHETDPVRLASLNHAIEQGEVGVSRQPCFRDGNIYEVVPFYHDDIAAAYEAEGKLPEELREAYLIGLEYEVGHITPENEPYQMIDRWPLRRAAAAQIVDAMLAAWGPTTHV